MRLLISARRFPPDHLSGAETVIEALWRQARRGHQVRLVAGYHREAALLPPEARAVDLRRLPGGLAHLRFAAALTAEARRFHPDVALSNAVEVPPLPVPTALIVHDLNFGRERRRRTARARELLYLLQSRRLPLLIAVSEATRSALIDLGAPRDRVAVIANGVDTARFCPPPQPVEPGEEGRTELCYPSRILPGKGQHLAVEAVARLSPALQRRVHLRLVGAAADRGYLSHLRRLSEGLPVSLHPDVQDIVPWIQRADLVLFPTLMTEGFGYAAVEAMACGRPVIWSDQPAIREATGGLGAAFPQGDASALAEAITAWMEDPEAARAIGRAGRALTVERYRWDRVWARYEQALSALL
ncbi:MAG: glycosyltransferase family 4 protein [Deltaproteobacteria bacterium]|nr:glycosyltransferase family 4 protein [Deltaproteobacteria bacterium]